MIFFVVFLAGFRKYSYFCTIYLQFMAVGDDSDKILYVTKL